MKTLTILILGVCIGFAVAQLSPHSIAATDPRIVGESGVLIDYDVIHDGKTLCSEPYISTELKTIDCD